MELQKLTLKMRRGATNVTPIRIESGKWIYVTITAVAQTAPLRITAPGHGLPDNWRAAIMNVKSVGDFAAANNPPKDAELHAVTVIDADTIEINGINGAAFRAHTGGGQIAYREPLDLNPYNGVRMDVKAKINGESLLHLAEGAGLRLDSTERAVWFEPTVEQSMTLPVKNYVFDIELLRTGGGGVDPICAADSTLVVTPETTTTE